MEYQYSVPALAYRVRQAERKEEKLRVESLLKGKTLSEIKAFAISYFESKRWRHLVGYSFSAVTQPRKYRAGDIVFDVKDDKTPYIFLGAGNNRGGSQWLVFDTEGKLHTLHNIQFAEEERYATKGLSFRRLVQKAILEHQLLERKEV